MSETHYNRLKWYNIYDNSKINVSIKTNSTSGAFIDVTVKYTPELPHELDKLIEKHEKEFQEFYKESMSY